MLIKKIDKKKLIKNSFKRILIKKVTKIVFLKNIKIKLIKLLKFYN